MQLIFMKCVHVKEKSTFNQLPLSYQCVKINPYLNGQPTREQGFEIWIGFYQRDYKDKRCEDRRLVVTASFVVCVITFEPIEFQTHSAPPNDRLNLKSGFVKWCSNDRLSNIWPKYILLSSLKFSSCQLSEQGSASSDRSIKVTNSSKQICIKNKISLSSVT